MSYYFDSYGYARPAKKLPQNVDYSVWAPKMWSEFTDLGNNFKSSQDFASQVHSLISQIPCPECKSDGEKYVQTNPPENVNSKAAAQQWVQTYHNHVNSIAGGWGRDLNTDPWYSTMWMELHETANDFNPYTFADNVRHQIDQIPCPPCSSHSQEFLYHNPPENVKTRDQAMFWMCKLHNMASYYAGNEIVDCALDPEGYGYVSGHRDYDNDFFYGKGGGGGGGQQGGGKGGKGKGKHKHGGKGGGGGHKHGGGGQGGGGGGRGGGGQWQQQGEGYGDYQGMPMTPEQIMCADNPIGWPQDPMCQGQGSNFYMSKAQVKASGWPQCSKCLSHGRNLRDCSLLGECQGPWSDGATPDDLKTNQERLARNRISVA